MAEKNGYRGTVLLPLAVLGGWAAGAVTAFWVVRREIGKLSAAAAAAPTIAVPAAPVLQPVQAPEPEISEEILAVLAAAVAAFLGKKARIRRARLLHGASQSSPWAQQGRVSVQASHNLGVFQR